MVGHEWDGELGARSVDIERDDKLVELYWPDEGSSSEPCVRALGQQVYTCEIREH